MKYEDLEWFDWDNYKQPPNFKNLIGQENDNFKIIGRAPSIRQNNGSYTTMWNCLCKHCGEYCVKNTTNFKSHNSCGCIRGKSVGEKLTKDLTNQTFGWLTALYKNGSNAITRNAVWHCRCICGQEIDVDSNNLTTLHTMSCGCIKREKSIGAMNIESLLKQNHISYKTELTFPDLRGEKKHPYFYDFGIYQNNILVRLIEYDGIQHYEDTWGEWARPKSLETQQERDKIKNEYALSHNIPLVRIPYWMRDKITLDMLLGDEYLIA